MNSGDLIVISIVVLSGLIALFRGLIREVLSLAGWVGAALVTLWGFRYVQPLARNLIGGTLLADILAGAALFVLSLVVFSMISHAVSNLVRNSGLSALDRTLGFVFGLARGLAMVGLAYLALALWVWAKPSDRPAWIVEARTLPLVEATADLLRGLAPPEFRGRAKAVEDEAARRARQAQEAQRALRALSVPALNTPASPGETGYKTDARRELERLIQSSQPPEGQTAR